jgi:beta-lactamase class A
VVKVMLLVAYLRREGVRDRDLNGDERDLLGAMITTSDNRAADGVFATVGEDGLRQVAAKAGMRSFVPSQFWGGSGITAADQAAFLGRLERWVPRRHEDYAWKLLRSIVSDQRWAIADVAPRGWELGFKGGWYMAPDGWRVNQVARLTRGRRSFALAVLTDQNPSFQYGRETIAGVAKRLMGDLRR